MDNRNPVVDRIERARERGREMRLDLARGQGQVALGLGEFQAEARMQARIALNLNVHRGANAGAAANAIHPRVINNVRASADPNRSLSSSPCCPAKRKASCLLPESVDTCATSEVEQDTFTFMWTLKQFTLFQGNEEIKSPMFKGGPKSNHTWQLKISPRKKVDNVEYLSVHLILTGFGDNDNASKERKVKVRFQISIVDHDGKSGKQAGSPNMNVCEFKKQSIWGYDKFISTQDLLSPVKKLVEEDVLRLHCRIWIEGDVKHHNIAVPAFHKKIESPEQTKMRRLDSLTTDFKTLLESSEKSDNFADVTIVTKTKKFKAHKCVLAARSKVFAAMFQTNMRESQNNEVAIDEFSEDVVKAMLEHMYTGETDLLGDEAGDLLRIAEMYDLQSLKDDCERALAESLTIDNVAQILVYAHFHSASNLKPHVINFINRHKDDVVKTESFKEVAAKHSEVFVDLYLSLHP